MGVYLTLSKSLQVPDKNEKLLYYFTLCHILPVSEY